jgi:Flp pilus assembly protein TadD
MIAGQASTRRWIGAALAAATLAAFTPALTCDFISLDDDHYVWANPRVTGGLTPANIAWAWTHAVVANWHPLTLMSLQLDATLFGPRPWGFHLTNLLIHAANVLLLWRLLARLTGSEGRAAVAAALWAVHPLRVESVVWVAERKDVLSALFALLAIGAYAAPRPAKAGGPPMFRTAGWMLLSLLCKPMMVTLPALLLLMDVWPLRRVGVAEIGGGSTAGRLAPARALAEKWPLIALAAVFCVVAVFAQRSHGAMASIETTEVGQRLVNMIVSYGRYLLGMVWFDNLAIFYPYLKRWPWWWVANSAAALTIVSAAAWRLRRSMPHLIVGWAWFLGSLIPVIGLVQVGSQSMADRYTYLPSIGLILMLVWSAPDPLAAATSTAARRAIAGATAIAVLVLGYSTWRYAGYWKDTPTIFTRAIAVTTGGALSHMHLGKHLSLKGEHWKAAEQFQQVVRALPGKVEAYYHLGHALMQADRFDLAINVWDAAIKVDKDHVPSLAARHRTLLKLGRVAEAEEPIRRALELAPKRPDLQFDLGKLLCMLGKPVEAETLLRTLLESTPDFHSAHNELGIALLAQGRVQEAITSFRTAVASDNRSADARNNLGYALSRKYLWSDAIPWYLQALEINADHVEAHVGLGEALIRTGRRDEGVEHLQRALRLAPGHPEADQLLKDAARP